jgi:hypothetical protein
MACILKQFVPTWSAKRRCGAVERPLMLRGHPAKVPIHRVFQVSKKSLYSMCMILSLRVLILHKTKVDLQMPPLGYTRETNGHFRGAARLLTFS